MILSLPVGLAGPPGDGATSDLPALALVRGVSSTSSNGRTHSRPQRGLDPRKA